MSYRTLVRSGGALTPFGRDFESKLRESLGKKIQMGREGMDLNEWKETKKKLPRFEVFRDYSMSEEVIRLGCKLNRRFPSLQHYTWLHWMTDNEVVEMLDKVEIYTRSVFFAQYGQNALGKLLEQFFQKPVEWIVDPDIEARVAA